MDNPWATVWDNPDDQCTSTSWSTPGWPTAQGTTWLQGDSSWVPSTSTTSEQDITAQGQRDVSQPPTPVTAEPHSAAGTSVSDHQSARSTSPSRDPSDPTPETTDGNISSVTSVPDQEDLQTTLNPKENDWSTAWGTTPSSDTDSNETQSSGQWEAARQEKEKLDRAVPPELLESLLRHCQQVLQEIWPASGTKNDDSWKSGLDNRADIVALLAQLLPTDPALPPTVQFSATATAKAMNEALKLTRHLPVSASSPLSRLLASRGSVEWEKSIKAKQDIAPNIAHVGWRVLDKEDRLSTLEESKSRKVTGGLLSFWNRRVSGIQAAPVETLSERSTSPVRSSQESVSSAPHRPSSRDASPSKTSTTSVPLPPPTDSQPSVIATAAAPSAVSRFLNRFSRARSTQHGALALSSDDLEFLSDIVPSASDLNDEDINGSALDAFTGANHSSPLPPKLPPPIPPPPKQPIQPSRPSSALALETLDGTSVVGSASTIFQMQAANHISNVPALGPTSSKPAASLSRTQSPALPLAIPTAASGRSSTPLVQQAPQLSPQFNPRPQSSFVLPLPQKTPPLLAIPPLLPPPPVSPPQTPRPNTLSSTMRGTDTSFHDSYDSDDEFSAFTSFPPSAPPFPSSDPYPCQGHPSPPSPPPRRSYERTHYPSSSSSSTISPASQSSLDRLYSTRSSISASLDSFDEFVSPPSAVRGENRKGTPSPPPLPVKPQLQHQQPPRLDTFTPRVYHAHTLSQTLASPTANTSLMNGAFPVPSVSDVDHRRTQTLVNHAAARGGMLWPNSPDLDEPQVKAIPPPLPTSASPKSFTGQEDVDLLSGDTLDGISETLPPLDIVGAASRVSPLVSRARFGDAGDPGKGVGSRNQLQPSPQPLPPASAPALWFSSLAIPVPLVATNPGSSRPVDLKQTGRLSAQDLSFFEGL